MSEGALCPSGCRPLRTVAPVLTDLTMSVRYVVKCSFQQLAQCAVPDRRLTRWPQSNLQLGKPCMSFEHDKSFSTLTYPRMMALVLAQDVCAIRQHNPSYCHSSSICGVQPSDDWGRVEKTGISNADHQVVESLPQRCGDGDPAGTQGGCHRILPWWIYVGGNQAQVRLPEAQSIFCRDHRLSFAISSLTACWAIL